MASKKPSSVAASLPSPEEAFRALEPMLRALPAQELIQTNVMLEAVANVALQVHARATEPKLFARFKRLPAEEFDLECVSRCAVTARAIQHIATRQASAEAVSTDALVAPRVVTEATVLKAKMLKVLEYHLEDEEALAECAGIRSGMGYLDLAQDLRRLAALYMDWRELLAADRRRYAAADEKEALRLADELSPQDPGAAVRQWVELGQRAWTQLAKDYAELRDTALWLHRRRPDLQAGFPSLVTASRPKASTPEAAAKSDAAPV